MSRFTVSRRLRLGCFVLALLGVMTSARHVSELFAQNSSAVAETSSTLAAVDDGAAVEAPRPKEALPATAGVSTAAGQKKLPLRQTYIPLNDLLPLLHRDRPGVFMQREEFLEIYRQARAAELASLPGKGGIIASSARYRARVNEDQLQIEATLEFEQFQAGWQMLELPLQGVSIELASIEKSPARLGRDSRTGNVWLIHDRKGKATLTLQLSTPLHAVGGDKATGFGLIPTPVGTMEVELAAGRRLLLNGLEPPRPAPLTQPAVYSLAVGGQSRLELRLTTRSDRKATDSLLFATTALGVRLAPGEASWQAAIQLQSFGRPLDRLEITVPPGQQIADVESNGLEAWELADAKGRTGGTTITLRYRQPLEGSRNIVIRGLSPIQNGKPWKTPALKIAGVVSHAGTIVIRYPSEVHVRVEEESGVRRGESPRVGGLSPTRSASPVATSPNVKSFSTSRAGKQVRTFIPEGEMSFDFFRDDYTLSLALVSRQREILVSALTSLNVTSRGTELGVSAKFETRHEPLFQLQVLLPADWKVSSVEWNGATADWSSPPEQPGVNHIRVTLPTALAAGASGQLVITARGTLEENVEANIPIPRFPEADFVLGSVLLKGEDEFSVETSKIEQMQASLLGQPGERAGFRYETTRQTAVGGAESEGGGPAGKWKFSRRAGALTVNTLTFSRLDPSYMKSHIESTLRFRGGGLRRVSVGLPANANPDARFVLVAGQTRIVEQRIDAPADGERMVHLQFDRFVLGDVVLMLDLETPVTSTTDTKNPPMVHRVRFTSADLQTGVVAVEAGGEQRLNVLAVVGRTPNPQSVPLGEVDPVDIPDPMTYELIPGQLQRYVPKERIVAAYRTVSADFFIALNERRFDRVPLPSGFIHSLNQESVIGPTGEFQHVAKVELTVSGVQSLRAELPRTGTLWAILLDNSPLEVRQDGDAYIIPLTGKTSTTHVSDSTSLSAGENGGRRLLTLYYRTERDPLGSAGRIVQMSPKFQAVAGTGATEPLLVLQQDWTLSYPPDTRLTSTRGDYDVRGTLDSTSLLGEWTRTRLVVAPLMLAGRATVLLLLSGVVGLLAFAARRKGLLGLFQMFLALVVIGLVAIMLVSRIGGCGSMEQAATSRTADTAAHSDSEKTMRKDEKSVSERTPSPAASESPQSHAEADRLSGLAGGVPKFKEDKAGQSAREPLGRGEKLAEKASGQPAKAPPKPRAESRIRSGQDEEKLNNRAGIPAAPPPQPVTAPMAGAKGGYAVPQRSSSSPAPAQEQVPRDGKPMDPFGDHPAPADKAKDQPTPAGRTTTAVQPKIAKGQLSVAVDFSSPEGYLKKQFVSQASSLEAGSEGSQTELNITYENVLATWLMRLVGLAGMLALAWWLRNAHLQLKALLGVLGLAVPFGLAAVVPSNWLMILDALFLGTIGACVIWLVRACCKMCCPWKSNCNPRPGHGDDKPSLSSPPQTGDGKPAVSTLAVLVLGATFLGAGLEPAIVSGEESGPRSYDVPATTTIPDRPHVPSVIVPYDAGTDPLASKRIFISTSELLRLQRLAKPDSTLKLSAPVGATVSAARYLAEFQIQNGKPFIVVTGELAVHSFRDTPVTVTLPLGEVMLQSAMLDGVAAPVTHTSVGPPIAPMIQAEQTLNSPPRGTSNSLVGPNSMTTQSPRQEPQAASVERRVPPRNLGYQLTIEKPGLHRVDLTFAIPAGNSIAAAGEFTIPFLPVAAGRLTLALPVSGSTVRVNGSSGAYRRVQSGTTQHIEIPIDKGGAVTVRWEPATGGATAGGDVVHAESIGQGEFVDAGGFFSSRWTFRVFQGGISEMTFLLPEEVRVRTITGSQVAGWELGTTDEKPTLKVFFRERVTTTTDVAIDLFLNLEVGDEEATELVYPTPVPLNVIRSAGTIAIHAPSHLRIDATAKTGAVRIPVEQAVSVPRSGAKYLQETVQSAFRFVSGSPRIDVKISRKKAETTARSEHAILLTPQATNSASKITFELKGLPRSRLAVQIPEEYQIASVEAPGLADWHLSSDKATLHLNLTTPRLGSVPVAISGRSPRKSDAANVELILPLPMDVSSMTNLAAIWFDEEYVATSPKQMGWNPVSVAELPADLRNRQKTPPQFAFRTADPEPNLLTFPLTRGTVRLSGDSLLHLDVGDSALRLGVALRWTISGGRTDRFVFTTPDSFQGKLEFPHEGIRSISTEKAPNNRTRWTILTSRPREGVFLLGGTAVQPLPPTELTAPSIVLESQTGTGEMVAFAPLETQRSFVILTNHSSLQVIPAKTGEFQKVSADLLPIRLNARTISAAAEILRLNSPTTVPTWTLRRHARQATAAATVQSAEMTTVLSVDGSWKTAVVYRVKNRTRQFLALRLPEGASLLSVFVEGRPARAVHSSAEQESITLIPLPRTSEVDLSFQVHVVLGGRLSTGALPKGGKIRAEELNIPAPHVVSDRNHPFGIPVSQTRWRLYVPDKLNVTPVDDPHRNNMTEVKEENGLFSDADRLKEAAELIERVNAAPESISLKQKEQALANARMLQAELAESERSAGISYGFSGATSQTSRDTKTNGKFYGKSAAAEERKQEQLRRLQRETSRLEAQIRGVPKADAQFEGLNVPGEEADALTRQWYFEPSHSQEGKETGEVDPLSTLRFSLSASESGKDALRQPTSGDQPQMRQMYQQQGELNELNQSLDANFARQQPVKKQSVPILNQLPSISRLGREDRKSQWGTPANRPSVPQEQTKSFTGKTQLTEEKGVGVGDYESESELRDVTGRVSGKLSLALEIPQQGQLLEFTKVGGEPKLVLAVRPNESWQWGMRILWTIVWLAFAIALIIAMRRAHSRSVLVRLVATSALAVGILLYFTLPGSAALAALVLASIGAVVLAIARYRPREIPVVNS